MTEPERDPAADGAPAAALWRLAGLALLGLGLIFALGVLVGFAARHAQLADLTVKSTLIGAALVATIAAMGWGVWRQLRGHPAFRRETLSRRERKIQAIWGVSFAIGAVIGAALILFGPGDAGGSAGDLAARIVSNDPIPPWLAAGLVAILCAAGLVTIQYYRLIDEHELAAQSYASTLTFNLYMFFTATWWIAAKGGLTAPVDAGTIFLGLTVVWTAVWAWRRYR